MTPVDELVAFVRARIAEDEQIALAAFDPKHPGEWVWRKDSRTTVMTVDGAPIEPAPPGVERGPHIAHWYPKRVLREVEAKRRLVERCEYQLRHYAGAPTEAATDWLALRAMAFPHSAHQDYREEWRP